MVTRFDRSCLFVVCTAFACSTGPAPAAPTAATSPTGGNAVFLADRPAALRVTRAPTGHLLVHPQINGRSAGAWIFDTGAGMCVVSTPEVESLGLAAAGSIDAVGIGGATTAKTFRADSFELGPLQLRDHELLATDLSFLTKPLGEKITGVVGYGLLSQCIAELDFVLPGISLHDPAAYELRGATWAELDLEGRTPAVRARIEGHKGLFQLDTGQNSSVVFQHSAVQKWQLTERDGLRDSRVRGVGGDVAAKAGTVAWIEFGGIRQERVEAVFLLEAKGSRTSATRDGAIGATLLRPFTMITDYPGRRIAFRAPPGPAQPR